MWIPRSREFDLTLALFREGYDFIATRCDALHSDLFASRLGLQKVICMRGAAAAEFFYGSDTFTRNGAMPLSVLMLLQDFGSVQLLDGAPHRHRKAMFRAIGTPEAARELAQHFEAEWERAIPRFDATGRVVLFDELELMLTRCGAAWAGVPLSEGDAQLRAREYSEMLQATGSAGPRMLRALWLRRRTERWAADVIRNARGGEIAPPPRSALHEIAFHRDHEGRVLHEDTAAIELINVLRAIVAVARFIVFAAKALHEQPQCRKRLQDDDGAFLDNFAQEVRRITPFFAFIGGRACKSAVWNGYRFEKGDWVLLDLYGTNKDKRTWQDPDVFNPDRFTRKVPTPFEFVPQGAGDADVTHRCPGEYLTVALMKTAVNWLARGIRYEVPDQDLSVSKARIPAFPASRFVMMRIRRVRADTPSAARASEAQGNQGGAARADASASPRTRGMAETGCLWLLQLPRKATNGRALEVFRAEVLKRWRQTLRRRSQKAAVPWARMVVLADDWLPEPRILHPWPDKRFAVRYPR
jgi:fatty-acid peroxygenase